MGVEKKLSDLSKGQQAVISGFANDEIAEKLLEMGFIPGETITVDNLAPFGDPLIVCIAGYHVGLRKSEAAEVLLETT